MQKKKLSESVLLGRQIKQVRRSHGITQEQLAEHIHVSPGWMGRIERRVYFPNVRMLIRIATALDVTVKDLFPF